MHKSPKIVIICWWNLEIMNIFQLSKSSHEKNQARLRQTARNGEQAWILHAFQCQCPTEMFSPKEIQHSGLNINYDCVRWRATGNGEQRRRCLYKDPRCENMEIRRNVDIWYRERVRPSSIYSFLSIGRDQIL